MILPSIFIYDTFMINKIIASYHLYHTSNYPKILHHFTNEYEIIQYISCMKEIKTLLAQLSTDCPYYYLYHIYYTLQLHVNNPLYNDDDQQNNSSINQQKISCLNDIEIYFTSLINSKKPYLSHLLYQRLLNEFEAYKQEYVQIINPEDTSTLQYDSEIEDYLIYFNNSLSSCHNDLYQLIFHYGQLAIQCIRYDILIYIYENVIKYKKQTSKHQHVNATLSYLYAHLILNVLYQEYFQLQHGTDKQLITNQLCSIAIKIFTELYQIKYITNPNLYIANSINSIDHDNIIHTHYIQKLFISDTKCNLFILPTLVYCILHTNEVLHQNMNSINTHIFKSSMIG